MIADIHFRIINIMSFRFLNHCRKISVPSLSIIFEGLAISGGPLRKQTFTSTGSKGHSLWFAIGGFRFVLCVFVAFELACEQALRGAPAAGREKEGQLATRSMEFEYLYRKSRCEMLIGGDDMATRFPRWNCSYRAFKSRRNTDIEGEDERIRSHQHLIFAASAR